MQRDLISDVVYDVTSEEIFLRESLASEVELSGGELLRPKWKNDKVTGGKTEEFGVEERVMGKVEERIEISEEEEECSRTVMHKLHRFSMYETRSRFYIVGVDAQDSGYSVLKIDRTVQAGELSITEDRTGYDLAGINSLLQTIDDGNKSSGGLKLICSIWGILGFVKFTDCFYIVVITKRTPVAVIGGHFIYQIDGTKVIAITTTGAGSSTMESNSGNGGGNSGIPNDGYTDPLTTSGSPGLSCGTGVKSALTGSTLSGTVKDAKTARQYSHREARYLGIFTSVDLTQKFYFSYGYNVTRSLEDNITWENRETSKFNEHRWNNMFVWNWYLLEPALKRLDKPYDWCFPVIHGFISQSSVGVLNRRIHITIIARRSRYFAGPRYRKRGINDKGHVANEVETEQIVMEPLVTSIRGLNGQRYANARYTSYVQHRGSIPLHWTQDTTSVSPKPAIYLQNIDPFYQSAGRHFNDLLRRYGAPIIVMNLIKCREKVPRESKLLVEYENAIEFLNQFLPENKRIIYIGYDMSRAVKTRDQDVILTLEKYAVKALEQTRFFDGMSGQVQQGIVRVNCIDCLDRTNAAQLIIGKYALGCQLKVMGFVKSEKLELDVGVVKLFTRMMHDLGDTLAIQYGGSHLVNTMATYRKTNYWQSSSRDVMESVKRYYNSSFMDSQRQEMMNLFLGYYTCDKHRGLDLWKLTSDYYLHHDNLRGRSRTNEWSQPYSNWFNWEYLREKRSKECIDRVVEKCLQGRYWTEYYRPRSLTTLLNLYSYRLEESTVFTRLCKAVKSVDPSPGMVGTITGSAGSGGTVTLRSNPSKIGRPTSSLFRLIQFSGSDNASLNDTDASSSTYSQEQPRNKGYSRMGFKRTSIASTNTRKSSYRTPRDSFHEKNVATSETVECIDTGTCKRMENSGLFSMASLTYPSVSPEDLDVYVNYFKTEPWSPVYEDFSSFNESIAQVPPRVDIQDYTLYGIEPYVVDTLIHPDDLTHSRYEIYHEWVGR